MTIRYPIKPYKRPATVKKGEEKPKRKRRVKEGK